MGIGIGSPRVNKTDAIWVQVIDVTNCEIPHKLGLEWRLPYKRLNISSVRCVFLKKKSSPDKAKNI